VIARKLLFTLRTILTVGLAACSVSFAQDIEASRSELKRDCGVLGFEESKCECIASVSEDIGDDLLMGRYILEGLMVQKGLDSRSDFEKTSNAIHVSQFYLRGGSIDDKDNVIHIMGVSGYLGMQLGLKCGVKLR
jgi:hypothetical protein